MSEIKKRKHGSGAYPKTENKAWGVAAKVALRERAAAHVGGIEAARVFDAYAGSGMMWRRVWRGAAEYVGCDVRDIYDPQRALYIGDSTRVMRAIDLGAFNVFDLDAYGAPWKAGFVLASRRKLAKGERAAVLFTDGASINAHFGSIDKVFMRLAGDPPKDTVPKNWERVTQAAIQNLAGVMGAEVAWCDVRLRNGSACYSAVGLIGTGAALAAQPGPLLSVQETQLLEPLESAADLAGGVVAETGGGAVAAPGAADALVSAPEGEAGD